MNNTVKLIGSSCGFLTHLFTKLNVNPGALAPLTRPRMRLAFWCAEHTLLSPLDGVTSLRDALIIASVYWDIEIILWNPLRLQTYEPMTEGVRDSNWNCADELRGYANIEVRMEVHSNRGLKNSIHQKLMITCDAADNVQAIVAGVNLLDGEYYFYDSSLRIRGPACNDVNAEWERRWRRANTATDRNSHLHVGGAAPVALPNAGAVFGFLNCNVNILTTNNEVEFDQSTAIRDACVTAISNANNHIYIENFNVWDPVIIEAIRQRMSVVPGLEVTVLTNMGSGDDPASLIKALVYIHLAVNTCTSLSYVQKQHYDLFVAIGIFNKVIAHQTVVPAPPATWEPTLSTLSHMQNSYLRFVTPPAVAEESLYYTDIINLINPRPVFFERHANFPAHGGPYGGNAVAADSLIHSKLMVVDSSDAFVGSCNFSSRSMSGDTEMMAHVHGNPAAVDQIGADLLLAHGVPIGGHPSWHAALRNAFIEIDKVVPITTLSYYNAKSYSLAEIVKDGVADHSVY
jgi:phosphatidylserine/phosphatidylglycerophosphate/cardiolipin synthase-like enzyme